MNRREFLKRAACLAAVPAFGGCRSLFSGKPGDFDDDLMVFISDVHVRPGEQCEQWQKKRAKATKPVFAGAHHPAREMRNLSAALADAPTCYGWIHGHNHRWYEYFASDRYKTSRTVRTAGLPSTGHWGDIGYATFRLGDRLATLTCRETEFFFPDPWAYTRVPDNWKEVARSHDGARIVFPYDK